MGCAFHWTQALWRKVSVHKKVLLFKTNLSSETVSCRHKYAFAFILIIYFKRLYNKSYLYCWLFQVQELGLQQAFRNDRGTHNREFKIWRRQRQRKRHKSMIWLVEWRKIIVLHVRHAFGAMFWRNLPNDVKFSYLRFWQQRVLAAVNLSLFAFTWKPFVKNKRKVYFAFCTTWNDIKTLNLAQSSILIWRFRCSSRLSFLNSLISSESY